MNCSIYILQKHALLPYHEPLPQPVVTPCEFGCRVYCSPNCKTCAQICTERKEERGGEEVHRRGGFWKKGGGGGRDSSALSPSGDSSVLGMSEGTTEEVFRYIRTTLHKLAACQPVCRYYSPTVCAVQWSLSKWTFRIGDTSLMRAISTTYVELCTNLPLN